MSFGASILRQTYWFATAAAVAVCVGMMLLRWGLRGRRVGDHPHCRACGYDLYGLAVGTGRCPECGGDLSRGRAKTMGRARPMPVVIGLALILLAIAAAGGFKTARMAVWSYSQKVNQPTWWLCRQLPGTDRQRVMWELERRLKEHEFSPRQAEAVGKAMLDLLERSAGNFRGDLGEFVQALRAQGSLSDEQWQRYASHAIQFHECECRSRVRRGDCLPFKFSFTWGDLVAYDAPLSYTFRLKRIDVNGVMIPLQGTSLEKLRSTIPDQAIGYDPYLPVYLITPDMMRSSKLIEGPQTLKLLFEINVYDGKEASPQATPLVTYELARLLDWTLVAADAQTVELVRSAEWEADLRRTIGPVWLIAQPDESGGADVTLALQVNYREVPVAMSIELRSGLRHWQFTRISSGECPPFVFSADAHLNNFSGDHVDVYLRGDPDEARRTTDISRNWDGEIAFRDVPVRWVHGPRERLEAPSKRMGILAE